MLVLHYINIFYVLTADNTNNLTGIVLNEHIILIKLRIND